MAVVEKEAFLQRIAEIATDESVRLGLFEDFTDSFISATEKGESTPPDYESDDNPYKKKHADILRRYEERFLGKKPDKVSPVNKESSEEDSERHELPSTQDDTLHREPVKDEDIFEPVDRI